MRPISGRPNRYPKGPAIRICDGQSIKTEQRELQESRGQGGQVVLGAILGQGAAGLAEAVGGSLEPLPKGQKAALVLSAGPICPDNCTGCYRRYGVATTLTHGLQIPKVNRPTTPRYHVIFY